MALTIAPGHNEPSPVTEPAAARPGRSCLGSSRVAVSATLAANETMDARRRRGEPVLPMGFGEAGLPAHPLLREALADAAGCTSYGPVAGHPRLREAAASYWGRRGLPTDADLVVAGPGSKALLFGLVSAIGGDVAVTRPSWVSYAAQAALAGHVAHFVPGDGGVPDAERTGAHGVGGARGGPPGPLGHRHAARQPDRETRAARRRPGPVLGRGPPRPDHHLRRDLPGPGPRRPGRVRQPRGAGPRADGGDHRAEQEPGPGRLAPRGGQAAGRLARP